MPVRALKQVHVVDCGEVLGGGKTKNARKGIETAWPSMPLASHTPSGKTKNARKGIETFPLPYLPVC